MSRRFIAAIVALSLAATGITASQAEAGDKRTRNIILGAATLAIIGAAIASRDRDDRNTHVGTSNPRQWDGIRHGVNPRHRDDRGHGMRPQHRRDTRHGVSPRPLPPRAQYGYLPNRCLRSYPVRGGGYVQRYDARCVERHRHGRRNRH